MSIAFLLIAIPLSIATSCGPRSPVPYQPLQVQDSEEAEGWDVYMYVAIDPDRIDSEGVEELLEWFRDVRFPEENRIRIFVWDNPQSALMNATADMVGSLEVDREEGVDEITVD